MKLFYMTMGRKLDWLFFFWWHPGRAPIPWHIRNFPDLVHKDCQKNTCKSSGVIAFSWRPIWEQISFCLNIHFIKPQGDQIKQIATTSDHSLYAATTTNTRRSKTDVNHGLYISASRSVRHFWTALCNLMIY